MKIACVGDCCVDRYLPERRDLLGGITANFARHAATVFPPGDEISIVSPIGTDGLAGDIIRPGLEACGLELHLTPIDGPSPVQLIEVRPDGEKHFVHYDEGVLGKFRIDDGNIGHLSNADVVVTQVFEQIRETFASVADAPVPALLSVDFADFAEHPDFALLERSIDRLDIGFFGLSVDDEEQIARIGAIAGRSGKLLVVTLGPQGSLAFLGNERSEATAVPVDEVIDTTGAGDAFAAGFLSRYLHGATVRESLEAGARLAATAIGHLGAWADDRG